MLNFLFETKLLLYQSDAACPPLVSGAPLLLHCNFWLALFLFTAIGPEFSWELQLPTQSNTDRAAACVPGLFTVRSKLAQGLQNQRHLWLQERHHWCTALEAQDHGFSGTLSASDGSAVPNQGKTQEGPSGKKPKNSSRYFLSLNTLQTWSTRQWQFFLFISLLLSTERA